MPRGFSDHEKNVITSSLIEQGRILFSQFGLQKTSIIEITKNVGIAPGSFYKFFNSKEELYFEILEIEEKHIKEQLFRIDISKENKPKKAIKNLFIQMINIVETNPLIRQLYVENNMEGLLRKLPEGTLERHFNNDSATLTPLIEKWKAEGILLEQDPEIISGMLRSLFLLTLHKKEIGETIYRETIERFTALIVDDLFKGVE